MAAPAITPAHLAHRAAAARTQFQLVRSSEFPAATPRIEPPSVQIVGSECLCAQEVAHGEHQQLSSLYTRQKVVRERQLTSP